MSKLKPTGSSPPASRLPDEMLMEVFLHLPPEPGHLLAASLVCKRWRRLVRNGAFLGRFRQLHGTPPLLGFFDNLVYSIGHRHPASPHSPRFTATVAAPARVCFTVPERMRVVLDSNRGRLLLYNHAGRELLVWDPMTGASRSVVTPRAPPEENAITAALVCAAGAHEDDDAGGQPGPFEIVVVMSCRHLPGHPRTGAWVYSSEAGVWGDVIPVQAPPPITADTNVHAGDCIYWLLNSVGDYDNLILELELPQQKTALIETPGDVLENYTMVRLVPSEDGGGIGFAGVDDIDCILHFWSRRNYGDGTAGWELMRAVNMRMFILPGLEAEDLCLCGSIVGFTQDKDVFFLQSDAGVFMINVRSMQIKKIPDVCGLSMYPFSSFYRRGRDIVGIDDQEPNALT